MTKIAINVPTLILACLQKNIRFEGFFAFLHLTSSQKI